MLVTDMLTEVLYYVEWRNIKVQTVWRNDIGELMTEGETLKGRVKVGLRLMLSVSSAAWARLTGV